MISKNRSARESFLARRVLSPARNSRANIFLAVVKTSSWCAPEYCHHIMSLFSTIRSHYGHNIDAILCFSQYGEQYVKHLVTKNAKAGDVYIYIYILHR